MMAIVTASAIFLVFIPCTRLLEMVPTWQDLQERDLVFFFKACDALFLVAMASLKETLFGLGSLDFGERDER